MFGFLNLYKPKGKTSHDVVAILRRITKVKQIGHTGTLDPFAEGVLPICIGKATRLIEYLKDDKAYIATVQFGQSTSTYDIEGEVVKVSNRKVDLQTIEAALKCFNGEIEQLPPIYSAIKVNGKKLYEYARKGEEVEIKPRKVIINELRIEKFDYNNQQLDLYVDCSKGTYIRSIANDLGETLGVYGYLTKLVRVKAGDFKLDNAIKLEELISKELVESNLIYPLKYLDYPQYELSDLEKEKVSNGVSFYTGLGDGLTLLTYRKSLAAVAEIADGKAIMRKVFL